jgi:hypothetical protein
MFVTFARESRRALDIDEVYWIGGAYYYELLTRGAFRDPDWQLLPARENPPVTRYLIGAALQTRGLALTTPDVQGIFYLQFAGIRGAWGEGEAFQERQRVAQRVSPAAARHLAQLAQIPLLPAQLSTGRALMLILGLVCAAALVVLGWQCGSALAGAAAALLFALHPHVASAYVLALSDIVALAFSAWSVVLLIALVRAGGARAGSGLRPRACLPTMIGCGLFVALACGAKMNALVVVLLGAATGLATFFPRPHGGPPGRRLRWYLVGAGGLAFVTFVALNPALHPPRLLAGLSDLFAEHARTRVIQEQFLGHGLRSPIAKLHAVAQLLWSAPWLLLATTALALVHWFRHGLALDATNIVCGWWLLASLAVVIWIPFGWGRYVLPAAPPTFLVTALALGSLAETAWRRRPRGLPTHTPAR